MFIHWIPVFSLFFVLIPCRTPGIYLCMCFQYSLLLLHKIFIKLRSLLISHIFVLSVIVDSDWNISQLLLVNHATYIRGRIPPTAHSCGWENLVEKTTGKYTAELSNWYFFMERKYEVKDEMTPELKNTWNQLNNRLFSLRLAEYTNRKCCIDAHHYIWR